uniref:CD82 molecule b n=1 Tax=Cyprinus carpio TaxID=7962 RepID=A0A8C1QCU1_CYPCA
MGKGCIIATKYFLFMFNFLFFIFGVALLGFGLWVILDNQDFVTVLHESKSLKIGAYILIGIGSLSMLMGFLGCIGAIYEVRCLLGLYFTCLLLILIAQVTAAVLIYFQRDLLKSEMSTVVNKILVNYTGYNKTSEDAWDYVQRTMKCCGWTGPSNWTENLVINSKKNNSASLYPCSCRNESINGTEIKESGLCEVFSSEWPVFTTVHTYSFTAQTYIYSCIFLYKQIVHPKNKILSLLIYPHVIQKLYEFCYTNNFGDH